MASISNSPFEKGFTLFPLLPKELRDQIWEMAAREAQHVPEGSAPVCIFQPSSRSDDMPHWCKPLVVNQKPLSLLRTTTESRAVARKLAQRAYEPASDILFLPVDSLDIFYACFCRDDGRPSERATAVRALAVDVYFWREARDLMPDMLRTLPNLSRIYLVFRGSSGKMNEYDPVELKKEQEARPLMRPLTTAEAKSIWFTVSYDWLPTDWATTASDHLDEWVQDIEISISGDSSGGLPSYWDEEEESLKIPVEASCFIGS